ncbi:TPA: acetyltransferase [Legionella pneumophila]|uniref:Aminoglycoside N(6')acetyltransferase n=2 Tax=Legionella TaxID=445 RepID=A0A0W0SD32_9GAMM|nr:MULTISPECIES: GNAT family N-acetyltransferase [Legionellaceae]HAU0263709.1 acetyltransferase [Legionella pneumophila]KTC81298.1 aminoglycoside N(6')acetyltransferase [Legionella brunensis]KTD62929.1 aminoglycoside N(6')acetyltransferase [Legionella santicrucis]QLZ67978.1 GNAT family N-acetyltransferase [Legionella sp. PC1000]HAU0295860.1 acetyltransferase [Legionella pneumophila]
MNMNNENRFHFKPVSKTQENLVLDWISQPHINEWLHGDGLSNTIKDIHEFLNDGEPWATHWIAYDNEIPFAYLITSEIEKSEEYPDGAVTLDLFICRLDYIGKGLSVKMIHEFILSQFSDAKIVLIDPEIANERAVHVYKKAGFEIIGEFIASWHPVPHYKMQLCIEMLKTKGVSLSRP